MRLVVVADQAGRVVAATFSGGPAQPGQPTVTLAPLPGQRLHELDVPKHLASLPRDKQLHGALEHHVAASGKHLERRGSP
jgi:hypothetical protein